MSENEKMSTEIAERIETPPAPISETTAFLAMIERAALNPAVDVDKMMKLMDMRERFLERQAKIAFDEAFSEMVPRLPSIDRNGGITVYSKSDRDYAAKNNGEYPPGAKPIQNTPYATIDDILEGINPVLSEFGFAVRFKHETVPTGDSYRIKTVAILTHKKSHSEDAETPPLMQDSSGSKNNVQSVGSSMKYGKRYALLAVLPIVSHAPQDADDDGKKAGEPAVIDSKQAATILDLIKRIDKPNAAATFLEYFRIESVFDLPAKDFDRAVKALEAKVARP